MGVDFIRERTKTFTKGWDHRRVELATPDLFKRQPEYAARTAAAAVAPNVTLAEGEAVTVQLDGEHLIAMRGLSEVARFIRPPQEILQAIKGSCGLARGVVEQFNPISGTVEISMC